MAPGRKQVWTLDKRGADSLNSGWTALVTSRPAE